MIFGISYITFLRHTYILGNICSTQRLSASNLPSYSCVHMEIRQLNHLREYHRNVNVYRNWVNFRYNSHIQSQCLRWFHLRSFGSTSNLYSVFSEVQQLGGQNHRSADFLIQEKNLGYQHWCQKDSLQIKPVERMFSARDCSTFKNVVQ